MSSRNDCVTIDALEATARVMAQANQALQSNHNGGLMSLVDRENFKRIPRLHSKEDIILKVPRFGFKNLRKFSRSWHALMLKKCCLDLICFLRKLSTSGRILSKD